MTTQSIQTTDTRAEKRYMLLLNITGDTTVAWEAEEDVYMRRWVADMMEEGYSFFIVDKRWFGLWTRKVPLTHIDDLKQRRVAFTQTTGDTRMDEAFQQGHVSIAPAPKGDVDTTRRATSVDEVMTHNTVALRPLAGG